MREDNKKVVETFYSSDTYFKYNRHIEEDSPWKIEKLRPLVDTLFESGGPDRPAILDVGGGSGLILKGISEYIAGRYGRQVIQIAMDLSPGFLEVQKRNNPQLSRTIHGSIEATPFGDKELDVVLLMDVLEHLHNPARCLREIKRIARYALLKVPLERNLSTDILELLVQYRTMRAGAAGVGHINIYDAASLERQIETHLGTILSSRYTDVFSYLLSSPARRERLSLARVAYCVIAKSCYRLSPAITARIFNDFIVMLVRC